MATRPRPRPRLRYVALRDLRNTPGILWERLREGGTVALTAGGEPRALVLDLAGLDLAEALQLLDRARAQAAVSRMRADAAGQGADRLAPGAINREIRAARARRPKA